jgi:dynein heavy chain
MIVNNLESCNICVIGESGSGKTTNTEVLAKALGLLFEEKTHTDPFYKIVDRLILNPKSISAGELYGEFNPLTNDWKDGIVPSLVVECVRAVNEGSENRKWIIFDGPVDAVWIENMNTVLDDNKTLCLANSTRIKLPSTLHMLFEVQDLKVASPATVSRCGMVYMEQVHIGIRALVQTWRLKVLKNSTGLNNSAKHIISRIDAHLEAAVDYVRNECKENVATSNNQLASSLLNLFASKLNDIKDDGERKMVAQDSELMDALLVWCFVWSIGANIVASSREVFSEWCRNRFSSMISSRFNLLLNDFYGCYVDLTSREVKEWSTLMTEFVYIPTQPYFNILVPTEDTTRYRHLLETLMPSG